MELLRLFEFPFEKDTTEINGVTLSIDMTSVEKFYEALLATKYIANSELSVYLLKEQNEMEQASTAIIARNLDRFLFPDRMCHLAASYHQLPSRKFPNKLGSAEAPDLYVLKTEKNLPLVPILFGDWKRDNFESARIETDAYASTVQETCYPKVSANLLLGLAGTPDIYQLSLYTPCAAHLHVIPINKVVITEKDKFLRFLAVLYAACHSLIEKPIVGTTSCDIQINCCDSDHEHLGGSLNEKGQMIKCARVIHCKTKGTVWKYYDTKDESVTNLNVVGYHEQFATLRSS